MSVARPQYSRESFGLRNGDLRRDLRFRTGSRSLWESRRRRGADLSRDTRRRKASPDRWGEPRTGAQVGSQLPDSAAEGPLTGCTGLHGVASDHDCFVYQALCLIHQPLLVLLNSLPPIGVELTLKTRPLRAYTRWGRDGGRQQ